MTSADVGIHPWRLLRNASSVDTPFALRLVVHGRSGGVVPTGLTTLVEELQARRQASVQLEVLTSEVTPEQPTQPLLLIPLLLWPGTHVREDVPMIRQRLRAEGADVTMLPFLGSWSVWWDLVASALDLRSDRSMVLVHHPLRAGVADCFLRTLSQRLGLPMVPFDAWAAYQSREPHRRPLPLALAPNRMTEALRDAEGVPPLLDHPLIRQGFIDLLAALP